MKGRMESGGLFMEGKEKKINKSMWKDERERKREREREGRTRHGWVVGLCL